MYVVQIFKLIYSVTFCVTNTCDERTLVTNNFVISPFPFNQSNSCHLMESFA